MSAAISGNHGERSFKLVQVRNPGYRCAHPGYKAAKTQ
jgi:hypothetical protein